MADTPLRDASTKRTLLRTRDEIFRLKPRNGCEPEVNLPDGPPCGPSAKSTHDSIGTFRGTSRGDHCDAELVSAFLLDGPPSVPSAKPRLRGRRLLERLTMLRVAATYRHQSSGERVTDTLRENVVRLIPNELKFEVSSTEILGTAPEILDSLSSRWTSDDPEIRPPGCPSA